MNKEDITRLEYEEKISAHQGYRLRQLIDEGYDVSEAAAGKITGFGRCNEMARLVKAGDDKGIKRLIEETAEEERIEQEKIEEYLRRK